jgi:hypothetical protein
MDQRERESNGVTTSYSLVTLLSLAATLAKGQLSVLERVHNI